MQIRNPGITAYVVGNLAPGTWYFSVSAYTSNGTESVLPNVAGATILSIRHSICANEWVPGE